MNITSNLINELEEMSALNLSNDEKQIIVSEIDQMLGFMDEIKNVEINNTSQENLESFECFAREDEVKNSVTSKDALSNATNTTDNYFVVPKVVD